MYRTLLISLVCLTSLLNAVGQESADYRSADQLQREVTFLLLEKNINDVTKQLDSESASSVNSLLRRVVIYARAGQSSRVRTALKQLVAAPDWRCPAAYDLRWLLRNSGGADLLAQRFYYEKVCPDDVEGAGEFVRLWTNTGDINELDTWLGERSNVNDEWLMQRVLLRATQSKGNAGAVGELLDALAAEIRANPSDWTRLDRYLKANSYANNIQDISWLADTFQISTAGEYFQLGQRVRNQSPQAGARLLQKSLNLPFTAADAKLVDDLINRYRSMGRLTRINWEKQLRYWTKRSLAETYQRMNQPLAAQPLIEELVQIKGDDILLSDSHQLAGAVQGDSGQRVVETKILGDEAARRSTSAYWLERTRYYDGRKEYRIERESYRQALVALAAKPDDDKALKERLEVVRSFAFFLGERNHGEEDRSELEKLLTRELTTASPQTTYAFEIARLIIQSELDLDELRTSLLAKQPSFFARLLDGRREWGSAEAYLIQHVVNREEVSPDLRQKLWSTLERLVDEPGSTRAYHLAGAMTGSGEWQRAIPLLRGYIEHALPTNWEGYKPDALRTLITAYSRTKQWQAAEKLLFANRDEFWRVLPNTLAEIALAAAQQNAIDDALRLWRISANINRRNLEMLPQLAQTKAKPQLLAMYLKMKTEDPLSTVPDLALRVLQ